MANHEIWKLGRVKAEKLKRKVEGNVMWKKNEKKWDAMGNEAGEGRVFTIWQVGGVMFLLVLLMAFVSSMIFPRERAEMNAGEAMFADIEHEDGLMIYDNPNSMFAQVIDGRLFVYRLSEVKNLDEITIMTDLTSCLKRVSAENFFWYSSKTRREAWCVYDAENPEHLEKAGDFLLKKLTPERGQPTNMNPPTKTVEVRMGYNPGNFREVLEDGSGIMAPMDGPNHNPGLGVNAPVE